jgi:hypothetical protein
MENGLSFARTLSLPIAPGGTRARRHQSNPALLCHWDLTEIGRPVYK